MTTMQETSDMVHCVAGATGMVHCVAGVTGMVYDSTGDIIVLLYRFFRLLTVLAARCTCRSYFPGGCVKLNTTDLRFRRRNAF